MKLNFYQQGSLEAPPVILIHGLFGSLSNLTSLGRVLAKFCCVYQPDLRNHGASGHSTHMNFTCMAADIIELMDQQGLTTAAIVGHSLGGKVAMQTLLSYPDRISRLVVVDIAPVSYPPHHQAVFAGLNALSNAVITQRSEAERILKHHIAEADVRAFLLKNLVRTPTGDYQLRLNLESLEANHSRLSAPPRGTASHKPVLFVKGGRSDYLTSLHRTQVLSLFPNASFKVVNGAGHWLHTEKPAVFNSLVKQFLQEESPCPGAVNNKG